MKLWNVIAIVIASLLSPQVLADIHLTTPSQLKLQVGKANPDVHNSTIEMVHGTINVPMKISGNINNVRTITSCQSASRYAVSLSQAKNIIKEFQQQPDQLRELLNADS